MQTLVFHSTKGGCGKSFLSQSVAYGLGRLGKKVLCLDLDQQGSLTSSLLGKQVQENLAHFFIGQKNLQELIQPALPQWGGLSVLPGGVELVKAVKWLLLNEEESPGQEMILSESLQAFKPLFDYCVIDCPPSRDKLVFSAFAAADRIYSPITPSLYDSEGLIATTKLVGVIASRLSRPVRLGGIIQNRWGRDKLAKDISKQLAAAFPALLCRSTIPDSVRAREAISGRIPLVTHQPAMDAPISAAINNLVLEIMSHASENRLASAS